MAIVGVELENMVMSHTENMYTTYGGGKRMTVTNTLNIETRGKAGVMLTMHQQIHV